MEPVRGWPERELRNAVLRGDETAWRVLYDQAYRPLYAYIYRRVQRSVERTEEVVQEVWMVAVRRIQDFDPDRARFELWLFGIARNVLKNRWRTWEKEKGEEDRVEEREPQSSEGALVSETLEREELVALAMASLPNRYRSVLSAKYREERSVEEIATRWGASQKAIESLLTRAREAFRNAYVRHECFSDGASPSTPRADKRAKGQRRES